MRYELPPNWHVRYDYHEHPRGISAIVTNRLNVIMGVGFAKYNPRDPQFSEATGKQIALGRALAGRSRLLEIQAPRALYDLSQSPSPTTLGRSIADELLASG